jgi:hypothetical protein
MHPKQWHCPVNQKKDTVTKCHLLTRRHAWLWIKFAHLVDYTSSSSTDIELKGIWIKTLDDTEMQVGSKQ